MTRPDDSEVRRFLEVRAGRTFGYGSARGDGGVSGSGYGTDDGHGSGHGSGYGAGSGYGYGSRYGDGFGDGISSGDGTGDGSGLGRGYDEGVLSYCGHTVWMVDKVPTLIYSVHGDYAKGAILRDDLTLQPCYIARFGNSFAHDYSLRDARREATLKDAGRRIVQERIAAFVTAHPDPDAECDGRDLYDWHNILTGSCEAGRDAWCRDHGLDPDRDRLTVREFLRLTADAYGGEIIRAVAGCYESMTTHLVPSGGRA